MAKEEIGNIKNSTKSSICDNGYIYNDVKERDHFHHVTGKYDY